MPLFINAIFLAASSITSMGGYLSMHICLSHMVYVFNRWYYHINQINKWVSPDTSMTHRDISCWGYWDICNLYQNKLWLIVEITLISGSRPMKWFVPRWYNAYVSSSVRPCYISWMGMRLNIKLTSAISYHYCVDRLDCNVMRHINTTCVWITSQVLTTR